jgi:uncharacterized protein
LPLAQIASTPEVRGLAYEDVTLTTADGLALHAWYLPHPAPRGVLLFCHGNAGNISHRLDSLQIFHRLGLAVLIFDYRGYGRSEGSPSEDGTYRDAEAAWRHLVEERGVAPAQIVLFGRSLGAAVAAELASRHTPGALILESAFTSVPDLAAELYPFLPARRLARFRYDAQSALRGVAAPVLIVHSPEDEIIPIHHGRRLYDAAAEPKAFLEIRGDHNFGFVLSGREYVDGLDRFLSVHLARNGKAVSHGGHGEGTEDTE